MYEHFFEDVRARAPLDMRPWVLESRRQPYDALFDLLARQNKSVEALMVVEQLHARTWLDAIVTTGDIYVRPVLGIAPAAGPLSSSSLFSMLGDREALIYVHVRGAPWRLHLEGRNVVELTQLPAAAETLLARWRQTSDDRDILDQLGAVLIPDDIAPSDHPLYIVASGQLSSFPFAALRRSQRYLIQDRPLVRLSGLAELHCRTRSSPVGAPIVIADAKGDLPQARIEAAYATQVIQGTMFIGSDATIERVKRARDARLVHVALHGDIQPNGGSLTLADGELFARTIIDLRIAPDIVVLAGCNTATGRDPESWGALSEAFLAAGTRTVVATLGPVADKNAAVLMRAFYAADGSNHPAAALAAAQRTVALSSKLSPSQWGKFVVWGHSEPSECHDE